MLFEAQWLRLRRLVLPQPGLPYALDGLKILHISDLHAGVPGPNELAVSKLARLAADADPDLVLFTGDMTDKKRDLRPYLDLLREIESRYGKFAVLGNHDHGLRKTVMQDLVHRLTGFSAYPGGEGVSSEALKETVALNRSLLSQADIHLLENECAVVDARGEKVQICGVDDFQYGYADMKGTASRVDTGIPLRVLLTHSPDAAACVANGDYHLLLAGHTHGGQICLPHPTRGKILLSTSGSTYGDGLYPVGDAVMYVTRGVGTTLLPLRLLSRPEITLIELASV